MAAVSELRKNHLLAALSTTEQQRCLSQLERVELHAGQVLYEAGTIPTHVLFPVDSIVSLLYETASGASLEIGVVGNEGMVGIALFMGGQSTSSRAVVRSAGAAWRLQAPAIKDAFEHCEDVRHVLLHYALTVIAQMTQMVACSRHHTVDQQLCRWLLRSLDRLAGNDIVTTQEQIAQMLGVRRESVTEASLELQRAGLIAYRRGLVSVLDRPGLEARACECYAAVRREQDRLMRTSEPPGRRTSAGTDHRADRAALRVRQIA